MDPIPEDRLTVDPGNQSRVRTTAMFDHAARKRSYQLLADAFGLACPGAGDGGTET